MTADRIFEGAEQAMTAAADQEKFRLASQDFPQPSESVGTRVSGAFTRPRKNMKIETILVPTDFSEQAASVLSAAVELAKACGARIELLHVHDMPDFSAVYEVAFPDQVRPESRMPPNADSSSRLEFGSPGRVIAKHAADTNVDLIGMGTRGLGAIQHALLGSVADRTIRAAPCPVLTIGAHANEPN